MEEIIKFIFNTIPNSLDKLWDTITTARIFLKIANYLEVNTNIPPGASTLFTLAIFIVAFAIIILTVVTFRKIWHLIKYG